VESNSHKNIAIVGAGNLGQALANGLVKSGVFSAENITLSRRTTSELSSFEENNFRVTNHNSKAVDDSDLIIIAVGPQDATPVLNSIKKNLKPEKQILISTMTGVSITSIQKVVGQHIPIVRIMPKTAVSICESMTCDCSISQ